MRLRPFFVLLCLSLCQCFGVTTGGRRAPFNDEERKLIFEELLKPSCTALFEAKTFEAMRAEHDRRRLIEKHPKFQHARSSHTLRWHVYDMRSRGQLPVEIVKKFGVKQKAVKAAPYSAEEQKLILQELLKPSCKTLTGQSTLQAIRAEHDRRRLEDKHPAFQHERSYEGLRSQIIKRLRSQLPQETVQKFGTQQQGASSSNPPNQQTNLQVPHEGQNEDELVADMIIELLDNTDFEIDFSKLEESEDK